MASVPNNPKSNLRNVRIDDQLWADAHKVAADNDTNVSEVISSALRIWVQDNDYGPDLTETAIHWRGGHDE